MNTVSVVIGANYGDEGKGLITDFLSSEKSLAVRFNGGAQAGHTVVTPEGQRHVFHSFGSGTLAGARTFWSKHFLVNPVLFVEERMLIRKLKFAALPVFVDPEARVTTPWDMMINQALEKKRGADRHGSCGLGIHETVLRSEVAPLRVSDLFSPIDVCKKRITAVRDIYIPDRMREIGLSDSDVHWLHHEAIYEHFLLDIEEIKRHTVPTHWDKTFANRWEDVVFEGAQGLRLDEEAPGFPHVTCSRTGSINVLELLEDVDYTGACHLYYVTRPYITRHGAGPLSHECKAPPFKDIRDETNVPSTWQGSVRFGWMDFNELIFPIKKDLALSNNLNGVDVFPRLVVTCCDQIGDPTIYPWFHEGKAVVTPLQDFIDEARKSASLMSTSLLGHGPTRNDVDLS